MRITIITLFLLSACPSGSIATNPAGEKLTFFQLNLWHECGKVPDAFQALVDQIVGLQPDIASFCELSRGDDDPLAVVPRLIEELSARGYTYYGAVGSGSSRRGIVSRYPISEASDLNGSVFKACIRFSGKEITVYSGHLYYRYYSCYLPRGYADGGDGSWDKLDAPVTDPQAIVDRCYLSGRPQAIREVITDALIERKKGRTVIFAGDFNEPSHLDWTDRTRDMWGHNGCVVEWPVSSLLYRSGFTDCFRELRPDPVTDPGFTFPAASPGIAARELTWAPDADERERIDFIYYIPGTGLCLEEIWTVGPNGSVKEGKVQADPDARNVIEPAGGRWPSDHKGLLAIFAL